MKSKRLSALLLACIALCSLCQSLAALAADSTNFNPVSVSIKAERVDETPIGAVISCPVAKCKGEEATTAEGYPKWLECNGQAINASTYPELSALIGARVPDLRGLFLRGYGSQSHTKNNGSTVGNTATLHASGDLGIVQGDATRNISGQHPDDAYATSLSGAFYLGSTWNRRESASGRGSSSDILFQSSRVVPTANENRPANMAVRYLIRAAK